MAHSFVLGLRDAELKKSIRTAIGYNKANATFATAYNAALSGAKDKHI